MNHEALKCPCCKKDGVTVFLRGKLDELEAEWGKPLHINSGYRCPAHNKTVGGAEQSQHMLGMAVDLATDKEDQKQLIKLARDLGWGGVGKGSNFTHLDLGKIRYWTYPS
jgi:zinc D-Ala-D-Ala carboxypeptidase